VPALLVGDYKCLFYSKKSSYKGVDDIHAATDDSDNFICLVAELIPFAIKKARLRPLKIK
jgi:hypothetical protein